MKRVLLAVLTAFVVLGLLSPSVAAASPWSFSYSAFRPDPRAEARPLSASHTSETGRRVRRPVIGKVRGHPQRAVDRWVREQETYYIEMRQGTPERPGRLLGTLRLADPERSTSTVWIEPAYFGWYKPPTTSLGGGVHQSQMSITYTGKSYLGNRLWTYTHTVQWEWDGTKIVGGRSYPSAAVYGVFWRCQTAHFAQWSFGGKGFSSWRRGWQGDFRDVVAGYMLQQVLPWIEFIVYRDGSVSWYKGT